MKAFICDRCHKTQPGDPDTVTLDVELDEKRTDYETNEKELCDECSVEYDMIIKNWWKQGGSRRVS